LDAAWQSMQPQCLNCGTVIGVFTSDGKKLYSKMFAQDNFTRKVSGSELWEDRMFIPSKQLVGAQYFALSVFDPLSGRDLVFKKRPDGVELTDLCFAIPQAHKLPRKSETLSKVSADLAWNQ
jgi:hypothetical protein